MELLYIFVSFQLHFSEWFHSLSFVGSLEAQHILTPFHPDERRYRAITQCKGHFSHRRSAASRTRIMQKRGQPLLQIISYEFPGQNLAIVLLAPGVPEGSAAHSWLAAFFLAAKKMLLRATNDKKLKLDFTRMRYAMSNHIASGMMDAALCNIISLSSTIHTQAHNIMYNCTKWCERGTYSKADMLMTCSWHL